MLFFFQPSRENYRKVFIIAASLATFGGTFFIIFCSGEQQSWNDPDNYSPSSSSDTTKNSRSNVGYSVSGDDVVIEDGEYKGGVKNDELGQMTDIPLDGDSTRL